jgi:hypothetical protein
MFSQCIHKAPTEYCHICTPDEHFIPEPIVECTHCIEGVTMEPWPTEDGDNDWAEMPCMICKGSGEFTAEQSDSLHKLRRSYWKMKITKQQLNL